jgi:beta-lactamase superfamily II metal-dependent hydrolase
VWYDAFRQQIEVPDVPWPKRLQPLRGAVGRFWTDDDIEILSPTRSLISACDKADVYNDASYVVKVTHGLTSRLLAPGDVESKAWNDMIDAEIQMRANVLIASHHGRNSGFHEGAMDLIKPEVVIISSDEIPDKEDAINEYRKRARVFSTREHGTITVRMWDDGDVHVMDRDGSTLARLYDTPAASAGA